MSKNTSPASGCGHPVEAAPRLRVELEQFDARRAGPASRELQRRLRAQLGERIGRKLRDARRRSPAAPSASSVSRSSCLQPLDLLALDAGDLIEVIVRLPARIASVAPRAERAVVAARRIRRRSDAARRTRESDRAPCGSSASNPRRGTLCSVPSPRMTCIICGATPCAVGEKVRIERELDDELRLRAARELGVEHFVAEGAEPRRPLDAPQEVGAAVQHVRQKRRLEDDVVALLHCRSSLLRKRFGAAVVRNLRHSQPFCFERGKVFGFVRVAFLLDQHRRLVVLGALQRRYEVDQSQRCDSARIRGNPTRSDAEKRVVPARICMVASPARAGRRVEGEGCNDSRYAPAQAFHASRCRASLPILRRRRRSQICQSGTLHVKRASSRGTGMMPRTDRKAQPAAGGVCSGLVGKFAVEHEQLGAVRVAG